MQDGAWRRELNALSALMHPNIIRVRYVVYATYQDKRKREPIGFAMEPMACSFLEATRICPFKDNIVMYLSVLQQVATALTFTHDVHRIAHRDVNLSNVLLDDPLNPRVAKLSDFGCAHFLRTIASKSRLQATGTQYFIAPEMSADAAVDPNPFPMDVYAFGVIIFMLLHPGATHMQLLTCCDPLNWIHVPMLQSSRAALCQLGCSCTNRDPVQRPSMKEVLGVLCSIGAQ